MAIFQLIDSKPTALIIPDDDNSSSALALAKLFIEKKVPFHVSLDLGIDEEWRGFEEYIIEDVFSSPSFAPHIIIDCHTASANNDMYVPNAELYPDAILLASSPHLTSSKLFSVLQNPNVARVNFMAGFFPALETIEFAPSPTMSDDARLHAEQFLQSIGLQPVRIDDIVGFVVPRIVAMLANEAAFAVMERVSAAREVDDAMRLGTNYPKGPLEWADEIGLDVVVALLDSLFAEYHQERYRACRLLRQYVDMQRFGKRVGKGFYEYAV